MPAEMARRDPLIVVCAHCGTQIRFSRAKESREETLAPSEALSEKISNRRLGAEAGEETEDRSATDPLGSEHGISSASAAQLAVRRCLVLVGAVPGENQLPLGGARTVVGRDGADITVDDATLSGRHFEVEARGKESFIRDLDSRNGTLLNGERIRVAQLTSGDKIQAGKTTFIFRELEVIPWDRSK